LNGNGIKGVLDELMRKVNLEPITPIPSTHPTIPAANFDPIHWKVEAQVNTPPEIDHAYHVGDKYRNALLTKRQDTYTFADPIHPERNVVVTSVDTSTLKAHTGLGASGKIVVADVDGDDKVEIIAGTAAGEVVKLRLQTDGGGNVTSMETVGSVKVSDHFGPSQVARLSGSSPLVLVAHAYGQISRLNVGGVGAPVLEGSLDNDPTDDDHYPVGALVLDMRKRPGNNNHFIVVNDEGEDVVIAAGTSGNSPSIIGKSFIEGRHYPILPGLTESEPAVYVSAHGNVKRMALSPTRHPDEIDDMSPHLYGDFNHLLRINDHDASYLVAGVGRLGCPQDVIYGPMIVLLKDDLSVYDADASTEHAVITGSAYTNAQDPYYGKTGLEYPDGLSFIRCEGDTILLLGFNFMNDEPYDLDSLTEAEIRVLEVHPSTETVTIRSSVIVPGPVTAIVECPQPPPPLPVCPIPAQRRSSTAHPTGSSGLQRCSPGRSR
jgi:hypothetical protein